MLRGSIGVPNSEANTSPWSCHWSPQPISLWLRQEFREDLAMQALVIATIPSVAAVLTAALGLRDLGMRRKLETSKRGRDPRTTTSVAQAAKTALHRLN